LLGASPEADIALLGFKPGQKLLLESKLGGQQLKPLKLGDSDKMAIGDTIMVLGYPLAQPHIKYTTGILSGQEPRGDFGECFTSDVAVSPGSSGGPCLNKNGEVIALIVGGATEGQSYNFLLPISREKILFKDLSGGVVLPRFSMGYDYAEITPETLVYLGSGADSGVLITSVEGGSLADMAGVKKGDLWSAVEYDGIRMPIDCHGYIAVPWSCSKMLPSGVFGRIAYGEEFSLEIWRDGVMHVLLCTKKIIPLKGVVYKHLPFQPSPDYEVFAGCVVVEATENLILQWLSQFSAKLAEGGVSVNSVRSFMQYADLLTPAKKGFSRVVITRVFPNSTFGLNKVFEGDTGYVKAVNGRPVNTISQYRAALLESSDTGYVVLETDKGAMGVVFLADALAQEPEMAKTYGYNFSQTYCALIQQDV
jgi:S1-C subfamily serine protease